MITGVFARMGDAKGFIDVFELDTGRPPLVCGLTGVEVLYACGISSGIGGGEIIMLGGSELFVDCGRCRDPFPNIFNPSGSVETGL